MLLAAASDMPLDLDVSVLDIKSTVPGTVGRTNDRRIRAVSECPDSRPGRVFRRMDGGRLPRGRPGRTTRPPLSGVHSAGRTARPPPSPVSTSQEGPPVPASPEPTPSEKLVEEKAPDVVMAVDKSLARLEQSILDRVIRFGNFFGSAKDEDARHPDYLIRWVNSLRMEEGGNFKYRTSARASFVLPKISNRLRLTVSGRPRPNPFLQGSRRTRGTRASIELSRRPALPIRSFATA